MQQCIRKLSETCHEMINLVQVLLGQALILQLKIGDDAEMQERFDTIYEKCGHLKTVLDQHRVALLELRQAVALEGS